MIAKSTQTKITVLIQNAGLPVAGLTNSNVACKVVKADGTAVTLNLSGLISEIDPATAPGLYLVTLPASILDQIGKISVTFYPVAPTVFLAQSYQDEVGISANDFSLIKKILVNNQIIDESAGLLRIYDDDGVTVALEYYLQNQASNKSIYDIRRKIRKV